MEERRKKKKKKQTNKQTLTAPTNIRVALGRQTKYQLLIENRRLVTMNSRIEEDLSWIRRKSNP